MLNHPGRGASFHQLQTPIRTATHSFGITARVRSLPGTSEEGFGFPIEGVAVAVPRFLPLVLRGPSQSRGQPRLLCWRRKDRNPQFRVVSLSRHPSSPAPPRLGRTCEKNDSLVVQLARCLIFHSLRPKDFFSGTVESPLPSPFYTSLSRFLTPDTLKIVHTETM